MIAVPVGTSIGFLWGNVIGCAAVVVLAPLWHLVPLRADLAFTSGAVGVRMER